MSTQPSASGDAATISSSVLGNRELWDMIMSCMSGYPHEVAVFVRTNHAACCSNESSDESVLGRTTKTLAPHAVSMVGCLSRRGVIVHLALALNDTHMLDTLHRLSTRKQYRHDAKLSFHKALRCAVTCNNVDMVQRVAELKRVVTASTATSTAECPDDSGRTTDCGSGWEPNLLRIAVMRADPNPRILDWLTSHLPQTRCSQPYAYMLYHAERGDVATVQWLHEHGSRISVAVMNAAARNNHMSVLQYLYVHSDKRCNRDIVGDVARLRELALVQFIVINQKRPMRALELARAASYGHLD